VPLWLRRCAHHPVARHDQIGGWFKDVVTDSRIAEVGSFATYLQQTQGRPATGEIDAPAWFGNVGLRYILELALDPAELRERLAGAEQELAEAEEGPAAQEAAERETRRLEAFLQIAENT